MQVHQNVSERSNHEIRFNFRLSLMGRFTCSFRIIFARESD